MIRSALGALLTASALAMPAQAGPYVNIENNTDWANSDFAETKTEAHIGYEGGNELYSWYVQGGPAYVHIEESGSRDEYSEFEMSGKIGGEFRTTERVAFYGELGVISDDGETNFNGKAGVKYEL